jgi:hypothetical protein
MSLVVHRQRDRKLMRFRDFLGGLPVMATILKGKGLSAAVGSPTFQHRRVAEISRQAKVWRHSRLEDGQLDLTMFGIDLLKFQPMNRACPLEVREIVGMAMSVIVAVAMPGTQVAPRADCNLGAKRDQCRTRDRVHPMTEPARNRHSADPNDKRDRKCRKNMPSSSLERHPRSLCFGLVALPRD